jgi:hypothetical protein
MEICQRNEKELKKISGKCLKVSGKNSGRQLIFGGSGAKSRGAED